ncbi:PEP-CTERM sorting domain-containing protein [Haloferula chungangensis]|uniref:PEP-CTERM sorting domain-containing protein n=1 Tax=Haloferula chungangensis TaxID=1048331 RepID=A0ABW2L9C1_9BACT
MKKTKKLSMRVAIGASALLAGGAAQAALINWGSSTFAYGTDETAWISTSGGPSGFVSAINASDSTNATVSYGGIVWENASQTELVAGITQNGVTITGGGANINYINTFGPGSFTSDPDNFYDGGIYSINSIAITGLTPGQLYELQFMAIDDRGTDVRNTIFGDGTQDYTASISAGTAGNILIRTNPAGQGSYVTGTFVADGSGNQDISIYGNRNADLSMNQVGSSAQINAFQLRAIPEPSVALLGGLGLIGLLRRRR